MDLFVAIFLVVLTSAIAWQLSKRVWVGTGSLAEAASALLDWAGLFSLFFGANLALGVLFVLVVRSITPLFVSLYLLESAVLPILSAVQAFLLLHWWRGGQSGSAH